MKRLVGIFSVAAVLVALPALHVAWGKAHVPIDMVQVCDEDGEVRNIRAKNLADELDDGGCRLPACDFANIFRADDACDNRDANSDGFCDDPGSPPDIPEDSAIGETLACTNPF